MLKFKIRKQQPVDKDGNIVIIDCTNNAATYVSGTLKNNDWMDITEYCKGLESLKLSER